MENLVMYSHLFSYYKNKKVFVTGHTGFKGSWLIAVLHTLGARTKGYALSPEYENGLFNLLQPLDLAQSVIADIRDPVRLQQEINIFEPDYIFHLAAQPLVRRSYKIPAETFDVNVTGTAKLLEAVSNLRNKCAVVVVTTDKVYENKEQANYLYKETDALGGYDPYSSSKACAELVINSFRNSFFNPNNYSAHQKAIASARAGNVIGGGDRSKDRLLPDIVEALQTDKCIDVRNPDAVRPWQHVLEPICGYLLLAGLMQQRPGDLSKAFNFGPLPGDHLKVKELVEAAIQIWGAGDWKDVSDPNAPHEAAFLKLDIGLAKKELNWAPKLNATTAIEWTINWYQQPASQQADYTFRQIEAYFSL